MPDPIPLRDLIYLDWERVRSLAAQLEQQQPGPATLLGNRFYQSEGETRTLHAEVFRAVENRLAEKSLLTDVAENFDFAAWTPDRFRDGQFIRARGMVRLLDYPWLASVMETMPKMLKVTQRTELSGLKQKRELQQITQQEVEEKVKEHQKQLRDLENWKMDELTDVVRELYGQSVRIKVVPAGAAKGEMFVGTCQPAGFSDSVAVLSQKYGCDITAGWVIIGMVNVSTGSGTPPLPTGNAVEDMFERLALAVNRIHRVASAPVFPGLSMTPVAIYREL